MAKVKRSAPIRRPKNDCIDSLSTAPVQRPAKETRSNAAVPRLRNDKEVCNVSVLLALVNRVGDFLNQLHPYRSEYGATAFGYPAVPKVFCRDLLFHPMAAPPDERGSAFDDMFVFGSKIVAQACEEESVTRPCTSDAKRFVLIVRSPTFCGATLCSHFFQFCVGE